MSLDRPNPIPRAIIATHDEAVRDFLRVHLEDRGFAVEVAHRAEYLRTVSGSADLLIAAAAMLKAAKLARDQRPCELLVLSAEAHGLVDPSWATEGPVLRLQVPFADPARLASLLDAAAARARARAGSAELVAAGH